MEAPGGEPGYAHTGWVGDLFSPELEQHKFQEVQDAEAQLLGRVTYESFAGAWPGYEGPFADRMNSMPKYVVSSTLRDPDWTNTEVLQGDPLGAVATLKEGDGGPLLVAGSRTLVHALLPAGLVDELRVMVFPVVLGSGFRVWPSSPDKIDLQQARTLELPNGVVELTYSR